MDTISTVSRLVFQPQRCSTCWKEMLPGARASQPKIAPVKSFGSCSQQSRSEISTRRPSRAHLSIGLATARNCTVRGIDIARDFQEIDEHIWNICDKSFAQVRYAQPHVRRPPLEVQSKRPHIGAIWPILLSANYEMLKRQHLDVSEVQLGFS